MESLAAAAGEKKILPSLKNDESLKASPISDNDENEEEALSDIPLPLAIAVAALSLIAVAVQVWTLLS